jgi:putative MATE family efflux protein
LTTPPAHPLLDRPILPTLLRLALPNVLAMAAAAAVGIGETFYVGRLGLDALAAMALVFPFVMLTQMFSAGAMGGGVSSAISRALGAGDRERAEVLALHALAIGTAGGLLFTALFLGFGPLLYRWLGGEGAVLQQARLYSATVFCGALAIWLTNTQISILRGTGDMKRPSATVLLSALGQIALGAGLGLGLGPLPRWGMVGVALGQVVAQVVAAGFLFAYLRSDRSPLRLRLRGMAWRRELFHDILKVGALACLSPLQTVLIILIVTALAARFGVAALAGYGIGARLEFLLVPIAFGVGVAAVPMVGMAIGAQQVARARRVAWTAGALSTAVLGLIGAVVATWPDAWAGLFTRSPEALEAARTYLRRAGPAYGFFGLGLTLYFASQGSGKVLGPVLASTLRLVVIAVGGWLLVRSDAPLGWLFALVGGAMAAYGLATAWVVHRTRWGRASP